MNGFWPMGGRRRRYGWRGATGIWAAWKTRTVNLPRPWPDDRRPNPTCDCASRRWAEACRATAQIEPINLLKLVDPARDGLNGDWSLEDQALVSNDAKSARLRIPYRLPEEYDYLVEFERISGLESISQVMSQGDHPFEWGMSLRGKDNFAFYKIDGRNWDHSPALCRYLPPGLGRRHISVVSVRKGKARAFLDGTLLGKWKTDYRDMSLPQGEWNGPVSIGLRTYASPTRFYRIELYEVSGHGSPIESQITAH